MSLDGDEAQPDRSCQCGCGEAEAPTTAPALGFSTKLNRRATVPMAVHIQKASLKVETVPSPTIVPAQANPNDTPMPKLALLIPVSAPGSSSGDWTTPNAPRAVSTTPMKVIPSASVSAMTAVL